jgi:Flp pilus assembly CpaE family ATPase
MPSPVLQVLLIEDNPGDAELLKETLSEAGQGDFQVHWAEALLTGLDRLAKRDIDLILLDLSLPDSDGLDGLNAIRSHASEVPVMILTGTNSESLALQAVQSGAQDYLIKGKLDGPSLARAIQHAIVRQRTHSEVLCPASRQELAGVVSYLGVKGGVGNTTIACHMAKELENQSGGRVLLLDLAAGDSIGFVMNASSPHSILDASNDILHLDTDRWQKLVAHSSEGLDVIQSGWRPGFQDEQPKAERVRFLLRLVRPLYRWIVIDLGRISPFSLRVAEEVSRLSLVSTCELLSLNKAKSVVQALIQAGIDRDKLALVLNRTPRSSRLSPRELEEIIGISLEAMLPDCTQDFANATLSGKRLGESVKFQKHVRELAARITGPKQNAPTPKKLFPFLTRAFRDATSGA